MRIVAGRLKGRALAAPRGDAIRPTSDRLRETVFNVLAHAHGDPVPGARVLDLFAGTGALGLEALSRGASYCLFVDEGVEARALVRANIEALGVAAAARLFKRDATRLGEPGPIAPFDLVFCDPPYRRGLAERALMSAAQGGWLEPGALIVVEEAADAPLALPEAFETLGEREVGDSRVTFARWGG